VDRRRLLLLLFCLSGSRLLAGSGSAREEELKAAYIYNFAKFTRWPGAGDGGVPNPLVIGVLGDQRVADSISMLTRGRTVGGSPIEVRSVSADAIPGNLHILYVAASQDAALTPTLFQPGRLTIGETDTFTQNGGIIRLFVESDRLRFEIDNRHAQKAGLALSSQLLMLARKVTSTN
jgi:uncharacterized protein DUF4154